MYLDAGLQVNDGETVRASNPDYSSSVDLIKNTDFGSGEPFYAVIEVLTYTGTAPSRFNIVLGDQPDFSGTNKIIGGVELTNTELEARDEQASLGTGEGGKMPIVVAAAGDHETGKSPSDTGYRYLGIQYDHDVTAPTVMTVEAWFTHTIQGDPALKYGASGFSVL